jgi:hypothetical protein
MEEQEKNKFKSSSIIAKETDDKIEESQSLS